VRTGWRNILVLALLLASLAEFWVRGPQRLLHAMRWNDFMSPYIQAKAWLEGKDPYSAQILVSLWPADNPRPKWVDTDVDQGALEKKRGMPTPYPLTSLVLLSPFTWMSWTMAFRVWMLLSIAAITASALALLSISGATLWDLRSQLFLAATFALAPLHTGLAAGNPAILSISLGVLAVAADRIRRATWAGVLLATAVCLKPTVAVGLLLYFIVSRRWKTAAVSCALVALVELVGALRAVAGGVHWLNSYLADAHRIFGPGSLADFARPDAIRFNMVNGQVFVFSLLGSVRAANLLCWFLFLALGAWWVLLCHHRDGSDVLKISAISILSLIPIYHRTYDALLLAWPLAWAILLLHNHRRQLIVLLMIAPFLVPGPILLANLVQAGRIPPALSTQWWWTAFVLSHEVWDLLLLSLVLLYFLSSGLRHSPQFDTIAPVCSNISASKATET
jgi:Glycosyltransferase family 87